MLQENLIKIFESSFRANSNLMALTDYFKRESFTYLEMSAEIARLHMLFEEAKLKKGGKVGLIGRNNPRWVMTYVAVITYGGVIVPILQDFNPNDINHLIHHSESELLFVSDNLWDIIDEERIDKVNGVFSLTDYSCLYERKGCKLAKFQKNTAKNFKQRYPDGFRAEDIVYPDVPNANLCLLSYTSGTWGFSKGVMLSVNNLTGQVLFCLPKKRHYPGSRVLAFLPLAHAYGCAIDMLCSLAAGTHVTLLGKIPSPKILLEALAEVRPNVICSVPLVIEKVVRNQVFPVLGKSWMKVALKIPVLDDAIYNSIRQKLIAGFGGEVKEIVIGGAAINAEVEEFLHKIKFPVVVGYGLTECGPLVSYSGYETFKPRSVGAVAAPNMRVRIDSSDPYSVPGEIQVSGEHVMMGYYKNEQATAEVFTADGWLRTGDIGTIDKDDVIYIRGRIKAMILGSNGTNIYPEEIESKLNNMYCVMESLVVEREGKLVALVVPDYAQADAYGIKSSDLQRVMDDNLAELNTLVAPYERVSSIVLYPVEFEKTPKRSIKRYLYNV